MWGVYQFVGKLWPKLGRVPYAKACNITELGWYMNSPYGNLILSN
jgi:hypothetical protein